MTKLLEEMILDYKDKGERVDEVLFQEVMKLIKQNRHISEIADYRINQLVYENKNLIRELEESK